MLTWLEFRSAVFANPEIDGQVKLVTNMIIQLLIYRDISREGFLFQAFYNLFFSDDFCVF